MVDRVVIRTLKLRERETFYLAITRFVPVYLLKQAFVALNHLSRNSA